MTAHDIAERVRLLSHTRYAKIIDGDLSLIKQARKFLENGDQETLTSGQLVWKDLFASNWRNIRHEMLRDDPHGRLLRSNSPFSLILGETDPERRRKEWQQAKLELSHKTT